MKFEYINDAILTDIAQAIRSKTNTTNTYLPSEMPEAISSIRSNVLFNDDVRALVGRTIVDMSNNTATKIGEHAVANCTTIKSATFSAATSIDDGAFYLCENLESINCPAVTSIGSSAFHGCKALTEVAFESAQTIRSAAFQGCENLEKVSLGSTSTNTAESGISSSAFYGCSKLTALILWAPLDTITSVVSLGNASAFTDTPIANGTGYIYVPRIQLDINGTWGYLNLSGWASFRSQFRAIEDYPEICGITSEPELEIPEDAVRINMGLGQTYAHNVYVEFDNANLSASNVEIVISDTTVASVICSDNNGYDEPYLSFTALKEGTALVELPQANCSFYVTVGPAVNHTIYKYGQIDVPIAEDDTVTIVAGASWFDCELSSDGRTLHIYDNGVGKGKAGRVYLQSTINGKVMYVVQAGY